MSRNPKNKAGTSVLTRDGPADYTKLDAASFPNLQVEDAGAILEVTDNGDRYRWSGTIWIQTHTQGMTSPVEISDRGVPGVSVFIQDQTTRILDLPLLTRISTTTLAVNATLDSRIVTLTAGHGAAVGDILELAKTATAVFMQSRILIVATNVITLDQPVNFPYTTSDIAVVSSDDMLVNGSSTPVIFSILPLVTQKGDMVRIIWDLQGTADMDFTTFGSDGALTIGCVLRIKNADGNFKNIMNFKTNGDIISHAFDHAFLLPKAGNSTRGFTARLTWGGPSKHGVVIRLDGSLNEAIELVVQEDLSGGANNTKFSMAIQGHELQT